MRKFATLLLVLVIFLALPLAVQAQAAVSFEKLEIQLWPDYDQAAVLVIYDFLVSTDTNLPAQVSLRLPAESQLLAVAKEYEGALINLQYQPPRRQGQEDILSFSVIDRSIHHVEFYFPYTRQGNLRSFSFRWPGDYAVQTLSVRLQQPIDATQVKTEPALSSIGQQPDGFSYYRLDLGSLSSGEAATINASYQKTTEALSVSSLDVQSTQPLDQNIPGQSMLITYLPWTLGALGILLLLIAGWVYWASGRAGRVVPKLRKRHAGAGTVTDDHDEPVHCSQCGKRTQAGDRFCRACGARIRRGE
jgi:hypothetical protein